MTSLLIPSISGVEDFSNIIEDLSIRFSPRFVTYAPRHQINIETKHYTLKTASTMNELMSLFKLRYECFLEENNSQDEGYDLDEFDHLCDHLLIQDKEGNTVGTYRVLCSLYNDTFYSQNEFVMDSFLAAPGVKVELGRACIDRAHRNGHVIDLLWKGIGEYCTLTSASFLFGCSSIKTVDSQKASSLTQYFSQTDTMETSYSIIPTDKYSMEIYDCQIDEGEMKKEVPPLLRSYFNAGAKVQGEPALDREFHCIDFLTVLDITQITSSFKRRYFAQWSIE